MKTVGAFEAKTHFSQLLAEVARGETITITKYGIPIARLGPAQPAIQQDLDALMDDWIEYRRRRNLTLGGIPIRELIDEGRG